MNHLPALLRSLSPRLTWSSFLLGALLSASTARADDVYIWAEETGGDVVFHFEGSIDLTGFPMPVGGSTLPFIHPSTGAYFNAGGMNESFGMTLPGIQAFGMGGLAAADSLSGDPFGFNGTSIILEIGYLSGTPISGTMTFNTNTLAGLGVDTTPFTIDTIVGTNTIHMFTMPPVATGGSGGKARPDLLIGKTFRKLRGDNVYKRRKPSKKQTIQHRRRIFVTNTSKAHLLLQNDGGSSARMKLRTSGDRYPRMTVVARSGGRNISGALKSGRFRPNVPAGGSVRVVYRLKTNRYYAGVFRNGDRDDTILFRLESGGRKDVAAMINEYR